MVLEKQCSAFSSCILPWSKSSLPHEKHLQFLVMVLSWLYSKESRSSYPTLALHKIEPPAGEEWYIVLYFLSSMLLSLFFSEMYGTVYSVLQYTLSETQWGMVVKAPARNQEIVSSASPSGTKPAGFTLGYSVCLSPRENHFQKILPSKVRD